MVEKVVCVGGTEIKIINKIKLLEDRERENKRITTYNMKIWLGGTDLKIALHADWLHVDLCAVFLHQ